MTSEKIYIADDLLAWWDVHGRHDLPWQQEVSSYRVWVSEIMLQQTQVATVERYFDRFMTSFPTLQALAAAAQDEVLHHWSGLGYYSRARNLHKAAQQVVADHAGQLPTTQEELLDLPGIGRSTAGAILSLSMQQRQPILDGNVKRVLARIYSLEGWTGSTANLKVLWDYAEQCTPFERVANYTQAIMDLGATVCSRSRPSCSQCPLQAGCGAFANDRVGAIPAPKPRKEKPRRSAVMVMAVNKAGDILLEKRPASGIWGGLWSFPELTTPAEVPDWCSQRFLHVPDESQVWPVVAHTFSHFHLDMTPVEVRVESTTDEVMDGDRWLWYNTRSPAGIGLAAPVARLLEQLDDRLDGHGETT